jgi:hypothetical protein
MIEVNDVKKMSIIAIACGVIFIVAVVSTFVFFTFVHTSMSLEPEVIVTNTNYHQSNFSSTFAEPDIWDEFNEEYGGRTSDNLRDEITESMKEQAKDLGEDPDVLEKCLKATGFFDSSNNNRLHCYAEKANYEYYINYKGKDDYEINELNETDLGPTQNDPCAGYL